MTPIRGFPGPQPSASGQGVVLGGGAHDERQTQGPSSSLPHAAPLKVVPLGHTLSSGFVPHSASAHCRYETDVSGSGSDQVQDSEAGVHTGFAECEDGGISPHADALHGATKLSASRLVSVLSDLSPAFSA